MSDSDSSDDDLGLFSFANKKAIVSTPPASPTNSEKDESESPIVTDRSLFMRKNKRKRLDAPHIIEEAVNQTADNENDTSITSISEDSNAISEKIRHYDNIVANICNIDPVENAIQVQPTKKFKEIAEKREQLIHNIDGVLNKFKRRINTVDDDLPHSSYLVADDLLLQAPDRPFMLKLRKGGNLHRFKVKMDTPLKTVLEHLAPEYNVNPELFILQLNDETLDAAKTPHQLGLTVIDIIEVLVGMVPQVMPAQVEDQKNVIKIKVQSTDVRNNTREYKAIKTKPLVECLFEACQDFGYEAAKYFFDGDAIDPRKTPMELELEEDDCLDIVEQT